MNWFNYIGLIFVVLLLIPNIIFAIKNKTEQKQTSNFILKIKLNKNKHQTKLWKFLSRLEDMAQ